MQELTLDRWKELQDVQWEINKQTTYTSDPDLYNAKEYWECANGRGDCEDYAIAKMVALRDIGWPVNSLVPACCWVETGGYHAVLIAITDHGDYVLDNRHRSVKPWPDLPYKWHKRLDPSSGEWVIIES